MQVYLVEFQSWCCLTEAPSAEDAWQQARRSEEARPTNVRLATEDDISWVQAMGGQVPRRHRIDRAIKAYEAQEISQGRAAELAGISRSEFIEELLKKNVPAIQIGVGDL